MGGTYFDKALLVTCIDGLGRFHKEGELLIYRKDLDTLECLRDLDRFLRRDYDDDRQALLLLGKCDVVSNNLLPLLKTYPSDAAMVYAILKVLILMTMPGKPGKAAQATLDIMHACKAAVTDADVLGIVTSVVHAPLAKFPHLAEDDAKTLQLFLTFVRNIACIPDALDVAKASAKFHFSTLSVDFLEVALEENVLELVALIAQHLTSPHVRHDAPVVLELLHDVYKRLDPREVIKADEELLLGRGRQQPASRRRRAADGGATLAASARSHERNVRGVSHIQSAPAGPRAGGSKLPSGHALLARRTEMSLYVRNVAGTSGQASIVKNAGKEKASAAATITEAPVAPSSRTAALSPRLAARLKVFTSQLLRGAFNTLMGVIRDEAAAGLHICALSPEAFCHFFRLALWFLQHCRYQEQARVASKDPKAADGEGANAGTGASQTRYQSISSVLCWEMINTVLRVWLNEADTSGKQKQASDWDLQESSIKVLREVVTLLDLAFHYGAPADRAAADALQRRLLHDDSKDAGVLNRIVASMKEFKKHDKKIARQERRESREYAADLAKALHVVLRVYERLGKEHFSVKKRTRYRSGPGDPLRAAGKGARKARRGGGADAGSGGDGDGAGDGDGDGGGSDEEKVEELYPGELDGTGLVGQGPDSEDEGPGAVRCAVDVEQRLNWEQMLRTIGHVEVIKLYMFLLEKYAALDAAALHAAAAYLRRVTGDLRLEPVLYQLRYLRQLHAMLADEHVRRSAAHKEVLHWAKRLVRNLCDRLAPPPPTLPASALPAPPAAAAATDGDRAAMDATDEAAAGPSSPRTDRSACAAADEAGEAAQERMRSAIDRAFADEGSGAGDVGVREGGAGAAKTAGALGGSAEGNDTDEAESALDPAIAAIRPEARLAALQAISGRTADLMLVELLFEKGPREVEMINEAYNWRKAVLLRREEATRPAGADDPPGGDDVGESGGAGAPRRRQRGDALGSDDDVDALAPDAPRVAAAASRSLLAGWSDEDKVALAALFETMNGRRSCKAMLLEDWNERCASDLVLTERRLTAVLSALSLKPGVMTPGQEAELADRADEFRSLGRRAPKRIAEALSGGFSVAAVKKAMARLGIAAPGAKGGAGRPLPTFSDSDGAAESGDEGGGAASRRPPKRSSMDASLDAGAGESRDDLGAGDADAPDAAPPARRGESIARTDKKQRSTKERRREGPGRVAKSHGRAAQPTAADALLQDSDEDVGGVATRGGRVLLTESQRALEDSDDDGAPAPSAQAPPAKTARASGGKSAAAATARLAQALRAAADSLGGEGPGNAVSCADLVCVLQDMLEAGKVDCKQLHLTATTPAEEVLVDTEEGRGLLRALDFAPRDGSWCCQLGKQSAAQAVVACGVALEAAAGAAAQLPALSTEAALMAECVDGQFDLPDATASPADEEGAMSGADAAPAEDARARGASPAAAVMQEPGACAAQLEDSVDDFEADTAAPEPLDNDEVELAAPGLIDDSEAPKHSPALQDAPEEALQDAITDALATTDQPPQSCAYGMPAGGAAVEVAAHGMPVCEDAADIAAPLDANDGPPLDTERSTAAGTSGTDNDTGVEPSSEPVAALTSGRAGRDTMDLDADALPSLKSAQAAVVPGPSAPSSPNAAVLSVGAVSDDVAEQACAAAPAATEQQASLGAAAGAVVAAAAAVETSAPVAAPAAGPAIATPTKRAAPLINHALGAGSPFAGGPALGPTASPWRACAAALAAPVATDGTTPAANAAPPARVRSVTFSDHTVALEERGARSWRGSIEGASLDAIPPGALSRRLFANAAPSSAERLLSAEGAFGDQENAAGAPAGRPARAHMHVDREGAPASICAMDAAPGSAAARTPLARVASQPDASAAAAPGSQRKRARTKAARLAASQGSPASLGNAAAQEGELTGSAPGELALGGVCGAATQPQESAALSQAGEVCHLPLKSPQPGKRPRTKAQRLSQQALGSQAA